jgi:hypothetical protein
MKRRRLIIGLSFLTIGLLAGILFYNSTITFIDRPFFLSDDTESIVVTRVDWMCNCADFIDTTTYKTNPVTEPGDDDYFFIEPAEPGQDWNRDHFINNKYVRLTGKFYLDKGIPQEYKLGQIEDKPSHARVFKFDKIEYLTTDNKEETKPNSLQQSL